MRRKSKTVGISYEPTLAATPLVQASRNSKLCADLWNRSTNVYVQQLLWRPYLFLLKSSVDKWTDGDITNTQALRRTYTDHYAHIRSKVPPERLLNFHPRDGWAPLCEFLGKETPKDEPFPRVNDAASTVRLHYLIVVLRLWHIGRKYLATAAVVGLAYGLARWWKP
jgi:hypothetical protein